jgi:hypothetical protein
MLQTRKLEINIFFLFFKENERGRSEKQDKTRTDLWPTADSRESLKTPNMLIKNSKSCLKPFRIKQKKYLKRLKN